MSGPGRGPDSGIVPVPARMHPAGELSQPPGPYARSSRRFSLCTSSLTFVLSLVLTQSSAGRVTIGLHRCNETVITTGDHQRPSTNSPCWRSLARRPLILVWSAAPQGRGHRPRHHAASVLERSSSQSNPQPSAGRRFLVHKLLVPVRWAVDEHDRTTARIHLCGRPDVLVVLGVRSGARRTAGELHDPDPGRGGRAASGALGRTAGRPDAGNAGPPLGTGCRTERPALR